MAFRALQARTSAADHDAPALLHNTNAALQLRSDLGGLSAREQLGALRPERPLQLMRDPVQREEVGNRPVLDALNAATMLKIIEAMKESGVWGRLLQLVRSATEEGTRALDPAVADEVLLEALIFVEQAFAFGNGLTLDHLLDDPATQRRIVGALQIEAVPEVETPAEEVVQQPLPAAGTFGMVTRDVELTTLDGSDAQTLKAGTAVEVKGEIDGQIRVLVHSGLELEGSLDPTAFKAQPRIADDDETGKVENLTYQKYVGELFLGEPSVNDVDQGGLGDCYVIAAMGAVAAANPEVIRKAVKYNGDGTYSVTFHELQRDGKTFTPHVEIVDAYLPTRAGGGRNKTAYAQSDKAFDPRDQALWPAIVEKAYAQWKGGYDVIGGGGSSSKAMEEITGVRSTRAAMPAEEDVVERFKAWQTEGKAVVCGTRDWIQQANKTGLLGGSGDGPYSGTLTDEQGHAAEIVKGSVTIASSERQPRPAQDDRKGGMTGRDVDAGSIDYARGELSLTYARDKGPAKAEDLEASYRFEGTLDQDLNLHGDHAYMFSKVEGDKLLFRNPWGPAAHKHPKPMSAADFLRLFETIGVNAVIPQQPE